MEHNLENEPDNGYNLLQTIKGTCTQSVAFYKNGIKRKQTGHFVLISQLRFFLTFPEWGVSGVCNPKY